MQNCCLDGLDVDSPNGIESVIPVTYAGKSRVYPLLDFGTEPDCGLDDALNS